MVERALSMREAAGSMPAFSINSFFVQHCARGKNDSVKDSFV